MRPEDMIDVTRRSMPSTINQYRSKVRNGELHGMKIAPDLSNRFILPSTVDLHTEPGIGKCAASHWELGIDKESASTTAQALKSHDANPRPMIAKYSGKKQVIR
jgi:hypothetical protein